jgi:hypothetical protein
METSPEFPICFLKIYRILDLLKKDAEDLQIPPNSYETKTPLSRPGREKAP